MTYLLYFAILNLNINAFALLVTTEGVANPNNVQRGRIYMEDNNTVEVWRTIPSHPKYAASSLGRIKRLTSQTSGKAGHLLSLVDRGYGYLCVTLKVNNKWKNIDVHRLVAETFLEGFKPEFIVNHKNAVRSDNRVSNLEYGTQSDNIQHSYRIGRQKKEQNQGNNNGQAKLTEKDILSIRQTSDLSWKNIRAIAENYNVSPSSIYDIVKRRTWKHI